MWNTLHSSFNTTLHHQVDISILDEIGNKQVTTWAPFSKKEFKIALENYKNSSTPRLDKLSWNYLKIILTDDVCITYIIKIANACIDLGYWPNHFKRSSTVIIPKPNKSSYDLPKSFRPIVLLNTLGKLIKKVIGERIQFHVIANDFIHPSQLGSLKFKSTIDVGIVFTYIIWSGWTKDLLTSTLAFDIVQFFLSLNHWFLTWIIHKAGLDTRVIKFFNNYLIKKKTNYLWNNFSSPIFNINIGVGQGSTLSPILLALYLFPFLFILEKHLKNLNIPVSIISQNKSFDISNSYLFCSYNVMTNLLDKFGLVVEHLKTEVFHFSRSHGPFNPLPLNLSFLDGPILTSKNSWKYLGFIFDRKLTFYQHVDLYSNRALSLVKCMKMLGNSLCDISLLQKWLLYRCCIFPITLYRF